MVRNLLLVLVLALAADALGAEGPAQASIDLRRADSLERLRQSNPGHYEKILQILAGLREEPRRAEGDWLAVSFGARDVDLSRYLLKTSHPPRQVLRFTLDDVRYVMHVTRTDLTDARAFRLDD